MFPKTYSSDTECHEVLRAGLQDQTEHKHADHDDEALSATPEIEDFGDGDVAGSGESAGHGIDNRQHGVSTKRRSCVRRHTSINRDPKSAGKGVEPDANERVNDALIRYSNVIRHATYHAKVVSIEVFVQARVVA